MVPVMSYVELCFNSKVHGHTMMGTDSSLFFLLSSYSGSRWLEGMGGTEGKTA